MGLPPLSPAEWLLAIVGALCIGISKSGFSGIGLATVVIMARLFPPRESTGVLLPLLIVGDICAVVAFHAHASWAQIRRMLVPTIAGIVAGYFLMRHIPDAQFGPVIGWVVLAMTILQAIRRLRPVLFERVPHSRGFAWAMGGWSGITTMLANAAGPVMTLYFLAIDLPKYVFVGTSAWFFLLVNVFKVPFSIHLGLIDWRSLLFNACLVPAVALGILVGRKLIAIMPQGLFEVFLLLFAGTASLRLIGLF
jgi:uncharacterized protein